MTIGVYFFFFYSLFQYQLYPHTRRFPREPCSRKIPIFNFYYNRFFSSTTRVQYIFIVFVRDCETFGRVSVVIFVVRHSADRISFGRRWRSRILNISEFQDFYRDRLFCATLLNRIWRITFGSCLPQLPLYPNVKIEKKKTPKTRTIKVFFL